jgi:glycosyltransferase involved in cell wall biosynthesis
MARALPIMIVQAFDAHAGAQRIAAALAQALRSKGFDARLWLGFGRRGFVSDARPEWRFMGTEQPLRRKLLYPLWLIAANVVALVAVLRGAAMWTNSIAAVPAAFPFMLFAPKRLVIHLHETGLPRIAKRIIGWAGSRGACVLAVSEYHRDRLGLDCRVLHNAVGEGEPPGPPARRDRVIFVGSTRPMKGLPLFIDVAQRLAGSGLALHAFLAAGPTPPDADAVTAARAAGVQVTIGETDPRRLFADGFVFLQTTDPLLWDETFSLVTAEALWQLVPVGAAGSRVLAEVAGPALAFNCGARDADAIAKQILALVADRAMYDALVSACFIERRRFSLERFANEAAAIGERALC